MPTRPVGGDLRAASVLVDLLAEDEVDAPHHKKQRRAKQEHEREPPVIDPIPRLGEHHHLRPLVPAPGPEQGCAKEPPASSGTEGERLSVVFSASPHRLFPLPPFLTPPAHPHSSLFRLQFFQSLRGFAEIAHARIAAHVGQRLLDGVHSVPFVWFLAASISDSLTPTARSAARQMASWAVSHPLACTLGWVNATACPSM